ncbi:MAG: amidohydrolase family protein [Actinomycetota bacterium]
MENHAVVVDGGLIVGLEPTDAPHHGVLAAGFIDLQVNGHHDVDVATADDAEWDRLLDSLAAQGVTTWCPTLISAPLDALDDRLAVIGERLTRPGPAVAGVHLEGPYLGGAPGAHRSVVDDPIDLVWLAALPPHVAMMTIAPERPDAVAAIRTMVGREMVVALGHTTASAAEATAAIEAGASLFTHLFNAAGGIDHRRAGALTVALSDPRVIGGLIADGIHVDVPTMGLAWRAKGAGGIALVTDAAAWAAGRLADQGVALVDGAPRLRDGTLAGSALTMPDALRRTVDEVGIDLADAVRAASSTPAVALGLDDRGSITPGRRADLVALTDDLQVEQTWIGGCAQLGLSGS